MRTRAGKNSCGEEGKGHYSVACLVGEREWTKLKGERKEMDREAGQRAGRKWEGEEGGRELKWGMDRA